jgi:hypothetical protein
MDRRRDVCWEECAWGAGELIFSVSVPWDVITVTFRFCSRSIHQRLFVTLIGIFASHRLSLSHYSNEYYCPISLLRVYGLTHLEQWMWDTWEEEK